ncbi:capsular biosynthesis protein [Cytobacillus pseudoceanisediminis]|uniref:capsular biosynthesis protein n=1 Tax=Cytobacillus pseudoceanisediminis TaxID=3051614 RepID=UPI003C2EF2D7
MRIVVDLDGTICELKREGQGYEDVLPLPNAISSLRGLKDQGHEIIIYTARNMRTYEGNLGKVIANIGKITLDWLEKYEVPYDEVVFGKPYGHIYIDDLGFKFESWKNAQEQIQKRMKES